MTDDEYKDQRERVLPLFEKWVQVLGLKWWKIRIEYERTNKDDDEPGWQATFSCSADWRYADALITAYCPALVKLTDEELEQAIVHELCHVFLNELRENKKDRHDHEERVATMLAKAFIWLRDSLLPEKEAEVDAT
jgi:hypothetical protein